MDQQTAMENLHQTVNNWVENYGDIFYNYLYKRVTDKTSVKDILQETFIAGWKNYSNFKKDADEKTWLFAILKNKLIDHYRLQARSITSQTDTHPFFDQAEHWTEQAGPSYWQDAATALNKKEFYEVLERCQSKLSLVQQRVFTMKYLDGAEAGFICKVLDITTSNYWVIIHRCKLHLRQCLEINWFLNNTK